MTAPAQDTAAWLVVIDAQRVFTDPDSPWGSPMWATALPRIAELLEQYDGRTVLTRWVAPEDPVGSWEPYMRQWDFAAQPADDPLFSVLPEVWTAAMGAPVVTETTFGKWGPDLRGIVGEAPHLVLAGVSTDCCVVSTALAAADAGATIEVVADACAGSTPDAHRGAIELMSLFSPQITIT